MQEKIDWVKTRLKEEERDQAWLSRHSEVSETTISRFLHGKQAISLRTWIRIEKVLT